MSGDSGTNEFAKVELLSRDPVAKGLYRIKLDVSSEHASRYTVPGQYVKLRGSEGAAVGYFVIASSPHEGAPFTFFVKEGGGAADSVLSRSPGETLEMSPVLGAGYPVSDHCGRSLLFLAIGSGFAAIRPLVDHVLASRADYGEVRVGYGARSSAEAAFHDDFERWERAGVTILRCLSQPEAGYVEPSGYIQDQLREEHVRDQPVLCICGTKEFEAGVKEALTRLGVEDLVILKNF